jgi:hypothetical protein
MHRMFVTPVMFDDIYDTHRSFAECVELSLTFINSTSYTVT